jgi:hypothetical protein
LRAGDCRKDKKSGERGSCGSHLDDF